MASRKSLGLRAWRLAAEGVHMDMATQLIPAMLAAVFAGMGGFSLWRGFEGWRRSRRHREAVRRVAEEAAPLGGRSYGGSGSSLNDAVVAYARRLGRDISLKRCTRIAPFGSLKQKWFDEHVEMAGLLGELSAEGFAEARARLAILCGGVGFVVGLVFSTMLGLVLAAVGAYLGWRAPSQAIVGRIKWRAHETERHLPEMLDVVALGMRSGLSFDTSLKLYSEHFDTVLSHELACAQQQWTSGLARRDEALRKVASSYDSVVFARTVETIIRSIRYGSSMVAGLESDAAEARSSYQAEREERIAKAPVKMMVPTGVLILPAMLMLVLGPVLLELMGGGF